LATKQAVAKSFDPRVDTYIDNAAEFARPILKYLRKLVHEVCPEVTETLKWRQPSFEYKGMLCGMGAFKQHCVFGFWKHTLLLGDDAKAREAMGSFGCLKELSDLPPKATLVRLMRKAMVLNDEGVRNVRTKTVARKKTAMHPELAAALGKKKKAKLHFDGFSPSQQREYVEWIAEAKTDATRARRIAQAIEWLSEGKQRNWKYMNC
jgi:uncharacterized protein YdeI (YjbR/CyaY-like superfamily)